eukprot:gb/GECG01002077.1/.p1 GENE.gb/GECG01002077.1/~~gb/GECG01002077.1/.p1  ORF type:complete len:634 (+),score=112.73 gb/GECG01002077.1/:1-1902(+)
MDRDKFGIQSNEERVLLARALAGNEKELRDKAVERVAVLLQGMDKEGEMEYLKLWKALFYCFWMSDKMEVQQQLATFLSKLIHRCKTPAQCEQFVSAFFKTIQKEWLGLDKHRLDKFLMLIEFFVKEMFAYCKEAKWSQESIDIVDNVLGDLVLSNQPDGIRFHVADVSLDQLVDVAPRITTHQFTEVARPFYRVLAGVGDHSVFKKVCLEFFHPLTGVLKDNLKDISGQVEKETATTDASLMTMQNRASEIRQEGLLPLGELDPSQLANSVFKIASDPKTPQGRRKTLYSMHGSLERLAGKYNQTFASGSLVSESATPSSSNQSPVHESSDSSKKGHHPTNSKKDVFASRSEKKKQQRKKSANGHNGTQKQDYDDETDAPTDEVSFARTDSPVVTRGSKKKQRTPKSNADTNQHSDTDMNGNSFIIGPDELIQRGSAKESRKARKPKSQQMEGASATTTPSSEKKKQSKGTKSHVSDTGMSDLVARSIASAEEQLTDRHGAGDDMEGISEQDQVESTLVTPKTKGKKKNKQSRSTVKKREREESAPSDFTPSKRHVRLAPDKNSEVSFSKSAKSLRRKLPKYSEREPTATKGVLKNSPSPNKDFISSLPSMSDLEKESRKTPKKGKKQKKSK